MNNIEKEVSESFDKLAHAVEHPDQFSSEEIKAYASEFKKAVASEPMSSFLDRLEAMDDKDQHIIDVISILKEELSK